MGKNNKILINGLIDIGLTTLSPSAFLVKKAVEYSTDFLGPDKEEAKQISEYKHYEQVQKEGRKLMKDGNLALARARFIEAMESNILHDSVMSDYQDCTRKWLLSLEEGDGFRGYEFSNRQFIFIVRDINHIAGCIDPEGIIKWTFTLNDWPSDIEFSTGRPEANTLYVAHPVQEGLYLPYEKFEETIFMEKVNELCLLAQALGATEISMRSIHGRSIDESGDRNWGAGGNVEYEGVKVGGDYRKNDSRKERCSSNHSIERVQKFAPMYSPYCPKDLLWLETDKLWQTMVKQRIEGNILHHSIRVKSSEACNFSSSTAHDVKASLETISAKVGTHFDLTDNRSFSQTMDTEWELTIDFEDKRNLTQKIEEPLPIGSFVGSTSEGTPIVNQNTETQKNIKSQDNEGLSKAEHEYLCEVKDCLADGEIGSRERRLLEKLREKLGISLERAATLESTLNLSLTDDEKEYVEEYKSIIADGEITPRERRLLDKLRTMLDISKARAKEIESLQNSGCFGMQYQ